eukprot:gnl/TRDRNA2_/TRDRNA2_198130_c0_seq1.p1 gnl/TRDRNA2_/TRDRNA2_198130_c0~~gnl/TRDRNA2_/TRDRNA2_198130_c0_seq1.p1  ORF type:complete len:251 (-),score=31.84 gnl/TRDRNA2_/TRDRNA2_198130_c0_seq1:129-881(-)
MRLLATLPVATSSLAIFVLVRCWSLAMAHGYLPQQMRYPPLSLVGFMPGTPEKSLYAGGFTVVGILFVSMAWPLRKWIVAGVEQEHRDTAAKGMGAAFVAFFGLWVHAVVPLQANMVDVMYGRAEVDTQSTAHQLAAALFFMASMYHNWMMLKVLFCSRTLMAGLSSGGLLAKVSFSIKLVSTACLILPAFSSFLLHPASRLLGASIRKADIGGLTQWWSVGCLIVFYGSYSIEMYILAPNDTRKCAKAA